MNVLRTNEPNAIRPLHVVMICLVVMTVAGGLLLLSAAKPTAPVDGAIEWQEQSPLRAVVQLLCLNYQVPTIYAGAVKHYILGIGAGLAILALSIAIVVRPRTADENVAVDDDILASSVSMGDGMEPAPQKTHIAPLIAAQVLVGLYLLWSFASSRWLWAPELAIGGSILLTIHFLWALGLAYGLSTKAAHLAARAVVVIAVMTAAVAIWYHFGRNPTLRADFPVGNPGFLAACLIPGILLPVAAIIKTAGAVGARSRRVGLIIMSGAAAAICLWAFYLADSRGPYVGLLFGILAMVFFALRGWRKWIPLALAAGVALFGWLYFAGFAESFSPTGRSATVRLRMYAWSYAWEMFNEKPFTGHGQGAFALAGDSYVVNDVLSDPLVFESRIAHAHNEWLEVMADLGSVGIVLIVAALLLTFRAGMAAVATSLSRGERWALVGLMGALAGLIVEECFGVGLRVPGVPTVFYTVIGLIWALSGDGVAGLAQLLSSRRGLRIATGIIGGSLGLGAFVVTQQDFTAARNMCRAKEALAKEDYDGAIRLASLATSQEHLFNRLNPQRVLANLYRLSKAHLLAAQYVQNRASNREFRAYETEPSNARLLALAQDDYRLSDKHCEEGSRALKSLILRSPGYIGHGRLEYWLNVTRARNAAVRKDVEKHKALLEDAAAAIKREFLRQPFTPLISADYLRVKHTLAGPALDLTEVIDMFARPLRHNRITGVYVELLADLAADPSFDNRLEAVGQQALLALSTPLIDDLTGDPVEAWAPEKLRLLATIRFIRGDYQGAREALEPAALAYDAMLSSAPLGAASCYVELADCRFFSEPDDPNMALASASRAIELAPKSRAGRRLQCSVETRMVDYALADDNEEEAARLLRKTGPAGVTEEEVMQEIGARYRALCESLLHRREAGGVLRKPPAELLPNLQRWAARAIELNPDDPYALYLAADMAFYVGDEEATVKHLRDALDRGLPPDLAGQFLQTALDKKPDSQALGSLWKSLRPSDPPEGPPADTPPPPEAQSRPAPSG